jgi:transcription-repair coupling factor (superfamily II helicase)
LRALDLVPMSEVQLTTETIKRFRQSYVATFGAPGRDDLLYEGISEGRRVPGLEHWLPLFHERLDTIFDYIPDVPMLLDPLVEEAADERLTLIQDHYEARRDALTTTQAGLMPYKPLEPQRLYLEAQEIKTYLARQPLIRLTPFAQEMRDDVFDCGVRQGRNFSAERAQQEGQDDSESKNIFDAVVAFINEKLEQKKRVIVATWTEGARERLSHVLADHGLKSISLTARFSDALALKANQVALAVWGLERGFETDSLVVIGEQDILGDRLIRKARKSRRAQDVIAEAASLNPGDLVVHIDPVFEFEND